MPAGAAGPSHRLMAALDVGMVLLYVDLNPVTARRLWGHRWHINEGLLA